MVENLLPGDDENGPEGGVRAAQRGFGQRPPR